LYLILTTTTKKFRLISALKTFVNGPLLSISHNLHQWLILPAWLPSLLYFCNNVIVSVYQAYETLEKII